jgi:4-hydroxy-tetrahydrodipicolinate synthase
MTRTTPFDGVFTALVTPFNADLSIDWAAFDRLLDRQLEAGITGLVPVGTTGEAATLTEAEALAVITRTVKRAGGQAYVLAGTGCNVTQTTIAASQRAADAGADGVLLITPYYNKPSQDGLIAHFGAVAEAVPCDIMLYSVPGRTGVAIAPATAATLSDRHANIVAIKEAGGDPARVTALRALAGPEFVVHCGDDGLALPFYALGARGLTSVLSNWRPELCMALYQAWARGDAAKSLELHEAIVPLAEAMFVESSPAPLKHMLAREGLISEHLRMPLMPLSLSGRAALDQLIAPAMALAS